jgi:hypothetical protein
VKLKRAPVGLADIKARRGRQPTKTIAQAMAEIDNARAALEEKIGPLGSRVTDFSRSRYAYIEGESPVDAHMRGVGYSGPEMPDKGHKDGSCNRSACQLPLAGARQWWMKDHMTGGRLYYCDGCAHKFNQADREFRDPQRCTLEEGT